MGGQRGRSRTSLSSRSLLGTRVRQLRLTRLSYGYSANLKVAGQSDIPLVVPDPALHPTSLGFEETKCPRIASLKERTSFQSFWGSESKSPDEFRDTMSLSSLAGNQRMRVGIASRRAFFLRDCSRMIRNAFPKCAACILTMHAGWKTL